MKKSTLFIVALMSAIYMSCDLNADNKAVATKAALETPEGRYSYAYGISIGKEINPTVARLKEIDINFDYSIVMQGIKDQLDTTKPSLMNDSQFMAAVQELNTTIRNAYMAKDSVERKKQAEVNLASQSAFLEKNKSELGVVATESGLQYIVLTEGKGNVAKLGDTVVVHYSGSVLNGAEFDNSIKRNQPFSLVLGETGVIKGWTEMLSLMKKGDKVKTWIPSALGYGEDGMNIIPGNALLIFDIEVLDIKAKK